MLYAYGMDITQPAKATRKIRPPAPAAPIIIEPVPGTGPLKSTVKNGLYTNAPTSKKSRVGNVYNPQCPAQKALETIASKWAILVLHRLLTAPLRFNALQRELPGISQKVLTQQLRRLEKLGLISRTVHPTVPPSVEYALTSAGRELKTALGGLCEWANKHAALLGVAPMEGCEGK